MIALRYDGLGQPSTTVKQMLSELPGCAFASRPFGGEPFCVGNRCERRAPTVLIFYRASIPISLNANTYILLCQEVFVIFLI
jgi:hypothetical protein